MLAETTRRQLVVRVPIRSIYAKESDHHTGSGRCKKQQQCGGGRSCVVTGEMACIHKTAWVPISAGPVPDKRAGVLRGYRRVLLWASGVCVLTVQCAHECKTRMLSPTSTMLRTALNSRLVLVHPEMDRSSDSQMPVIQDYGTKVALLVIYTVLVALAVALNLTCRCVPVLHMQPLTRGQQTKTVPSPFLYSLIDPSDSGLQGNTDSGDYYCSLCQVRLVVLAFILQYSGIQAMFCCILDNNRL
eukprot:993925-Pelagomonas_calceolata.AAC.1